MKFLVLFAVLVVGCSEAQSQTAPATVPMTVTTTTTYVAQLPALPDHAEGARCQRIANDLVAAWQPLGRVESTVTCVPSGDSLLRGGTGITYSDRRSFVSYPNFRVADAAYLAVIVHELAHAWRIARWQAGDVARYKEMRGASDVPGAYIQDYADVFNLAFGVEPLSRAQLVAPVTPELIAQLQTAGLLPH